LQNSAAGLFAPGEHTSCFVQLMIPYQPLFF
jgi:hypothetical protein